MLELQLSEPLDENTVHPGTVALVAWEDVGRCDLTPTCEKGSCERGTCQEDPLSTTDLSRLDRGEFEGGEPIAIALGDSPTGAGTLLRIEPVHPLRPHARHSLVVGAGVRDLSGAALEDERGETAGWRQDLVTAREGSSGPEARLVSPAPGQRHVPTNTGAVWTSFVLPVVADPQATLELEAETGSPALLEKPQACPGWVAGFCLAWSPAADLAPSTRYRPGGGTLQDRWGRPAIPPREQTWFRTGEGRDEEAPDLAGLELRVQGRCVLASLVTSEAVVLTLEVANHTQSLEGSGVVEAGVRVDAPAVRPGDDITVRAHALDLAGNSTAVERSVVAGPSFDPVVPRLALTEVLANPLGPEPDQEFVELSNLGPAVEADGLWIADRPWTEITAELSEGNDPPGDRVPAFALDEGALAVVVGSGYTLGLGKDPDPVPAAELIRLDSSIAEGGLKNAGEPLTLYRADPPALIATYGNHVDTGSSSHGGVSVTLEDPRACDLAQHWGSHPLSTSSPGALP